MTVASHLHNLWEVVNGVAYLLSLTFISFIYWTKFTRLLKKKHGITFIGIDQ